jgi:hypothetical protein
MQLFRREPWTAIDWWTIVLDVAVIVTLVLLGGRL